jgi:hypothetical protein
MAVFDRDTFVPFGVPFFCEFEPDSPLSASDIYLETRKKLSTRLESYLFNLSALKSVAHDQDNIFLIQSELDGQDTKLTANSAFSVRLIWSNETKADFYDEERDYRVCTLLI